MHVTTHATFPLPSHIIYMKSSQRICACVACSNATFFLDVLHGESKASSRSFAPLFAAAAPHANATAILQMLLRTFPGRILYHSYPHVRMQYDTAGSSLDLNPCFETINEQVRCAAAHLSRLCSTSTCGLFSRTLLTSIRSLIITHTACRAPLLLLSHIRALRCPCRMWHDEKA
jgi:hypothetical protein